MAGIEDMGEPEVSDDSISLTSTVASEERECYEVKRILAERKRKGVMEYLTEWKDYAEHYHSWLPRENFDEGDVFSEWTRSKMRQARGLLEPFDVRAWEKRKTKMYETIRLRRERRRDKKLRLSKQVNELISRPGEQEANIETRSSEPTPGRSDKRIKRRSVHQDSPPSSSSSAPSFSSSSEDSDRPLTSRQESEMFTPSVKWTQAETIALEEGLQTLRGPRWMELLGLYGRNGTKSQALKDKTPGDLYDKAKSLRQEFVDSGREPPEYLKPFSKSSVKSASSKESGTATPNIYSESRVQSRAVSKRTSRSTSADSMMAELHEMQRIREVENRENSRPQQNTRSREFSKSAREQEKESKTAKKMSDSKPEAPQASQAPVRQVEVALAKKSVEEPPKAAQANTHPKDAVPHTKGTNEVKEISKDKSLWERQPEEGPRAKDSFIITGVSQAQLQPNSPAPSAKESIKNATDTTAQPESSRINVPQNKKPLHEETARATGSGLARASTASTLVSAPSRIGVVGSGARLGSSKLKPKPKLGQIEPKKPSVTGDVTAAWNVEPNKRKSNNLATTNADPVDGQAPKRNYKLSVQNRIYKSRRDGRAPDPNRLVFIDPKTGKAPTTVPAPSTTAALSKTPLQLHQEELAMREAEERQAQEVEDAMFFGTSEPDPPPQSIDQNREAELDEQGLSEIDISRASASALSTTASGMKNGRAHIDSPTPPLSALPHPDPRLKIPLGPKIETKRMATMSLQDYTKRSISSTHLLNEAVVNSDQPYSSDDLSTFALRSYPSREQKNEKFSQFDANVVMGDIKFGRDDQETIRVKLVDFSCELKKLLLTIKSFPRTMHFVFETVCLASEYQAYFPAVSPL